MKVRLLAALLLLAGFVALVLYLALGPGRHPSDQPPAEAAPAPPAALPAAAPADCRACHPEVYAEWERSWHAKAWMDPFVREQSENFKKKDCIPCHAPRPVFERGILPGERVVERRTRRDRGVDCLSCHRLPERGVAAARDPGPTPCGAVLRPELTHTALCAPCHNQHNTVDEWNAAPEALKGENCNGCHMPEVRRKSRGGRPGRTGRDHSMPGAHAKAMLEKAFTIHWEIVGTGGERRLVVRIRNTGAAHNLPADSRHRALDLVLTFFKPGGLPYPAMDGKRPYGQEPGTYRLRFRNPYRSEQKENTQIPSGEERALDAAIPDRSPRAVIRVVYKLTPFQTDEEGMTLFREEVVLPAP